MLTCPRCGRSGAYLGFREVECINPLCEHHSERQARETGYFYTLDYSAERILADLRHTAYEGSWIVK